MEMLPLLILLIPFLTFSFLGMPIFISMGISSLLYILSFHQKIPLLVIPANMIGMLVSDQDGIDGQGFQSQPREAAHRFRRTETAIEQDARLPRLDHQRVTLAAAA